MYSLPQSVTNLSIWVSHRSLRLPVGQLKMRFTSMSGPAVSDLSIHWASVSPCPNQFDCSWYSSHPSCSFPLWKLCDLPRSACSCPFSLPHPIYRTDQSRKNKSAYSLPQSVTHLTIWVSQCTGRLPFRHCLVPLTTVSGRWLNASCTCSALTFPVNPSAP